MEIESSEEPIQQAFSLIALVRQFLFGWYSDPETIFPLNSSETTCIYISPVEKVSLQT